MRSACWLCLLVALGFQQGGQQAAADPYSLEAVSAAMNRLSQGFHVGLDTKTLVPLGDRCAVAILKIVDQRKLSDPKTAKTISETIYTAFQMPQYIQTVPDRQPQVSLFLLNYLKERVADTAAQLQIRQTIQFVERQTQVGPPGPDPNMHR
jgi:hypothetical protein